MKAMISLPMACRNPDEIIIEWTKAAIYLDAKGYEVVDTLFTNEWINEGKQGVKSIPLYHLANSLEWMSKCDVAYFCEGWENARGCKIEHEAAKAYGLEIEYEI